MAEKKVLLIWPAVHVNMVAVMRAFFAFGYEARIIVRGYGYGWQLLDEGVVVHVSSFSDEHGGMDKARLSAYLEEFGPDIVMVRTEVNNSLHQIVSYVSKRYRTISCDQMPARMPLSYRSMKGELLHFLLRMKLGLRNTVLTPVSHKGNGRALALGFKHSYPKPVVYRGDEREKSRDGRLRIMMVGKYRQARKRHRWILRALHRIDTPVELVMAGIGLDSVNKDNHEALRNIAEIKRMMDEINRETKHVVKMRNDIPPDDMHGIYLSSDIFVLPSENEPFAYSPLEAMAAGCAVVVPSDNGSSCYVVDGQNGLIFDTRSFDDFCGKVRALVGDGELRARLQENARETIRKNHTYEEFIRRFEEVAGG